MKKIPYPLRAQSIALRFMPFSWGLRWHKRSLTEQAKEEGEIQWYARFGPFQLEANRML